MYTFKDYYLLSAMFKERVHEYRRNGVYSYVLIFKYVIKKTKYPGSIPKKLLRYLKKSLKINTPDMKYDTLYTFPIERMPLLLHNKDAIVKTIAIWRLKIGK